MMHMCYNWNHGSPRKVQRVHIEPSSCFADSERKKLEKLASKEKVSSGEIIRRSLDSYKHRISRSQRRRSEVDGSH